MAPLSCALGREPLVVGKPEAPMLESIVQTYVQTFLKLALAVFDADRTSIDTSSTRAA